MSVERKLIPAALAAAIFYTLVSQPLSTALTTLGIASILYGFTKSEAITLGWVMVGILLRGFNRFFTVRSDPVGVEAFQAKDPVSVQSRIAEVRREAPLKPKVASVTGVLESADILDNKPLMAMDELAREGVPGASIPAGSRARVMIGPVDESEVPAPESSRESALREVPYLQNGPDDMGVGTALVNRGTALPPPETETSEMAGIVTGAGPAF